MSDLRSKFEEMDFVKKILGEGKVWFCDVVLAYSGQGNDYFLINGAWFAFQERQKKIDAVLKYIDCEEWSDEYGDNQCPTLKIKELLND